MKDGNKIWAVVKTGTNQDGRASQPITAPSAEQQGKLFEKVYTTFHVDPATIQYIEAHGRLWFRRSYFSDKIELDISCKSSARQTIHMECQA